MKAKRVNKGKYKTRATVSNAPQMMSARPQWTLPSRKSFKSFFANTIASAFLLVIGLAPSGFLFASILYGFGLLPVEPVFNHALIFAFCCVPLGALVNLLGIQNNKWFVPLMGGFFAYGCLLPVVVGAIFIMVIQSIGWVLGVDLNILIQIIYAAVFVASVCYGVFIAADIVDYGERFGLQNQIFSRPFPDQANVVPVVNELLSNSASDTDGGDGGSSSDGGGDGGD